MEVLTDKIVDSELVREAFKFWLTDQIHIRSPFPDYIHSKLRVQATENIEKWVLGLNPKAKEEVNDVVVAEKFEEIMFETALKLVMTEDEKITIHYPFLPRLGDIVNDSKSDNSQKSEIIGRELVKEKDQSLLRVKLKNTETQAIWTTDFELPV